MQQQNYYKTHRPFDKLRKKRTGSKFDAVDFHGRDIDLRSIAGVVEAGRRRDRKAGETNEDKIEELAERRDATARADASKEFYGGPKFNAERFAKEHKIDMKLRFDRKYDRPDQIVANPPKAAPPPKPKPKPSFQEVMYPKQGAPAITPRSEAPSKPNAKPTFQEALYPKKYPVKQSLLSAKAARPKATAKSPSPNSPAKKSSSAASAPAASASQKADAPGKLSPAPTSKALSNANAAKNPPAPTTSTAGGTKGVNLFPKSAPLSTTPAKAPDSGESFGDQVLRSAPFQGILTATQSSPTGRTAAPLAGQAAAQTAVGNSGSGDVSPNQEPSPIDSNIVDAIGPMGDIFSYSPFSRAVTASYLNGLLRSDINNERSPLRDHLTGMNEGFDKAEGFLSDANSILSNAASETTGLPTDQMHSQSLADFIADMLGLHGLFNKSFNDVNLDAEKDALAHAKENQAENAEAKAKADKVAAALSRAADAVAADLAAQGYSKADVEAARAAALAEALKGNILAAMHAAGIAATSGSPSVGGKGTGVPGATTGNAATGIGNPGGIGHGGQGTGGGHGGVGASGAPGASGTGSAPGAGGPGPNRG